MEFIVYLFSAYPGSSFQYYLYTAAFAIIMILIGLFFKYRCKKDKTFRKIFKDNQTTPITIGGIILILLGARYENIPYISMRALLFLSIGTAIYFLIKQSLKYKKEYPQLKNYYEKKEAIQKQSKKTYSHSKKKN